MTGKSKYDRVARRYVTRAEQAEISLLSQWFSETPVPPRFVPRWPPPLPMGHFGPLWAKCPGGVPCGERDACACVERRQLAVLTAHVAAHWMRRP